MNQKDDFVWLDSAAGGRFSILAAGHSEQAVFTKDSSPKDLLRFLDSSTSGPNKELPDQPFTGGWIGFMSYEAYGFNPLIPLKPSYYPKHPLAAFYFFETFFLLDHNLEKIFFVSLQKNGSRVLSTFLKSFSVWKDKHFSPEKIPPLFSPSELSCGSSQERYWKDFAQIQNSLLGGDYFELNYTANRTAAWPQDPWPLYLNLRRICPTPMMAFLKFKNLSILSASPETFFEVCGSRITTEPIKGTRGRGKNKVEDEKIKTELFQSAKDRAELLMVTDMLRSDLGRICKYGSIKSPDVFRLKSFSHYHHLLSTITGELKKDCLPAEIFCALFPGGSVTGAPKIKVMEHIDFLERRPRGVYTGAIGYLSSNGNMHFNLPIRTITVFNNVLEFATGGGIVADSRVDDEYQECQIKAKGLLEALALA